MKWYNNFVINAFVGCLLLAASPFIVVFTYAIWGPLFGDPYDDQSLAAIPWFVLFTVPAAVVLFLVLVVIRVSVWMYNGKDKLL
jgi:hypothetical protein